MSNRADLRRQHRRRQHLETIRRSAPSGDGRAAANSAELLEGPGVTIRFVAAIACLLGAQFLHWSVIDQHAQVWRAAGVFFFVLALAEGLMTVLLISRLRPWVAALGIVVSIIPVVVWAWDRSLGLPFGPTKGVRGTIGRSDVMSVVFELLTVVALWPFLRASYGTREPARLDLVSKIAIGSTVLYVVGFSYWAMLGDQGSIHRRVEAAVIDSASTTPNPGSTAPPTSTIALVPTQIMSYIGKEYSFDGPTTVSAGVTRINLRNAGVESHSLEVVRVPDSTPALNGNQGLEELFSHTLFGSADAPKVVAGTQNVDAGASSSLTVDLVPGLYILACGNQAADGEYHYTRGMIMELTVTAPTTDASTATTIALAVATTG